MNPEFSDLSHPTSGRPKVRYIYRDATGKAVLIANRYEKSDGGKYFMPFDAARAEWKAPDMRPLYNLDKVANADPANPVIMVEGEKCADALAGLGYLATTTFGGSNALRRADLSPLKGRSVFLWPDFDDPGLRYVKDAATILSNSYLTSQLGRVRNPPKQAQMLRVHDPAAVKCGATPSWPRGAYRQQCPSRPPLAVSSRRPCASHRRRHERHASRTGQIPL